MTSGLPPRRLAPWPIAALTTSHLVGGLLFGLALGSVIGTPQHGSMAVARNGVASLVAVTFMCLGARRWSRELALRVSGADPARAARAGTLSFGPVTIGVAIILAILENVIVEQHRGPAWPVHVVYGALFVPAAFIIPFVTALAVSASLPRREGRLGLAVACGAAAAGAYLLVYLAMEMLGWRVGAPDAGRRATMLVVTGIASIAATLAGGAAMGDSLRLLSGSEHDHAQAVSQIDGVMPGS